MELQDVIELLTVERRKQGQSQQAVADALGVSRQLISTWEGKTQNPKLEQIEAWAAFLKVPLRLVVAGQGAEVIVAPTLPVAVTRLAAIWEGLPEQTRSGLIAFLGGLEALVERRR